MSIVTIEKVTNGRNDTKSSLMRKYKVLGQGSSRIVFDIINGKVLKVAKGNKGILQNNLEHEIYSQYKSRRLCPVYECDGNFLIAGKAISLTDYRSIPKDMKEKVREHKKLLKKISKVLELETYGCPIENKELKDAKRTGLYKFIKKMLVKYFLIPGDIFRPSSWGIYNNRIVLIDYGCNQEIYRKYYEV